MQRLLRNTNKVIPGGEEEEEYDIEAQQPQRTQRQQRHQEGTNAAGGECELAPYGGEAARSSHPSGSKAAQFEDRLKQRKLAAEVRKAEVESKLKMMHMQSSYLRDYGELRVAGLLEETRGGAAALDVLL